MRDEPRGFRKLEVWQLARELVRLIYAVSSEFPKSEDFGLKLQIRRAAVSIPSNIAEGWGRNSSGAFRNALKIARGSLDEVDTQLTIACDLGYVSESQAEDAFFRIEVLGRKIFNLADRVATQSVGESIAGYDLPAALAELEDSADDQERRRTTASASPSSQSSPPSPSSQSSPSLHVGESDFHSNNR